MKEEIRINIPFPRKYLRDIEKIVERNGYAVVPTWTGFKSRERYMNPEFMITAFFLNFNSKETQKEDN